MQLTVKRKLYFSFGLLLVIMFGLSAYALYIASEMNSNSIKLSKGWMEGLHLAHRINTSAVDFRISEYTHIITPREKDMTGVEEELAGLIEEIEKDLRDYEGTIEIEIDRNLYDEVSKLWTEYLELHTRAIKLSREQKKDEAMMLFSNELANQFDLFSYKTDILVRLNKNYAELEEENNIKLYNKAKTVFISIFALSFILCSLLAFIISRSITLSIRKVVEGATQIAEGDLTQKINIRSKDEMKKLGDAFNTMAKKLHGVLFKISENAQQLAAASEELTASSEQSAKVTEQIANTSGTIAEGAERQLMSVKAASKSILQIAEGINEITNRNQEVTEAAKMASAAAEKGMIAVSSVAVQIKDIEDTIADTSHIIENLNKRSDEIELIVKLITDITGQTDLLALNAAIEAARAGEAGRGFAVVASEVRKLAEQSKQSAGQIKDLIRNIRMESSKAVSSVSKGTEKIREGIEKSKEVNSAFESIQAAIEEVEYKIKEVSRAIDQILQDKKVITKSIEVVEKAAEAGTHASQENAVATEQQLANMEEIASAAQALSRTAEDLNMLINQFKMAKK